MSKWASFAIPLALLFAGFAVAADTGDKGDKSDPDAVNPHSTSHRPRVRLGGIMIGAGYSHMSGPAYGYPGYYPYRQWGLWGAYDPFFYGPYVHPGFFNGFAYGPSLGGVKLKSADKDSWVYLNGALAGRTEKLKTMWLEPGVYNLEVRSGDRRFGQKVYILSGKTLHLTADMQRAEVRP